MAAPSADRSAQRRYDVAPDRSGRERNDDDLWLAYSVILIAIAGVLNVIAGIAAIGDSKFYAHDAHYAVGTLHTWGWAATFAGAVQLLVAWGIYRRNQVARWVGVFALGLNVIGQLLMLPAYPLFSLAIFALDLIAIFGLVAHGQRPVAPEQ
jgi:hypothetical protein